MPLPWLSYIYWLYTLRYQLKHTNQQSSTFRSELQPHCSSNDAEILEPNINTQERLPPPPPKRLNNNTPMYHSKETYNKSLEMFIKKKIKGIVWSKEC